MTQSISERGAAPKADSRFARYAGHFSRHRLYRRKRDFLWSLYNRVLNRRLGKYLPLRRTLRAVHLNGVTHPLFVRLGTTDWLVLEEIYLRNEYAPAVAAAHGARQIVDLGSNVGLSVRLWQQHFPEALIVAVEPDNENLAVCRMNTKAGPAPRRVCHVAACVAGAAGQVALDRGKGEWEYSISDRQTQNSVLVDALTVPQLLARCGIEGAVDLLKCDIEGAERDVFRDCREWISRVRTLLIELHPPYTAAEFLTDVARGGGDFDAETLSDAASHQVLLLRARQTRP